MCHSNGFTGIGTPAGFSTMEVAMAGKGVSASAVMALEAPSPGDGPSTMVAAIGASCLGSSSRQGGSAWKGSSCEGFTMAPATGDGGADSSSAMAAGGGSGGTAMAAYSAIHVRAVLRDTPHSRAAAEANLTIADIRQSGGLSRCRTDTPPVVVELIAKSDVDVHNGVR